MTKLFKRFRSAPRGLAWKAGLLVIIAALGAYYFMRSGKTQTAAATFVVRQGPLKISVLDGGSVEALESQEIRSEIKGYQGTKILSIVEEGYLVTEDDVKKGKVLVELDSSDLKQRIITEEIQYQSTLSGFIEAQQAYDIQFNQNISDIKAAELKATFARMDMEKFLGDQTAGEIIAKLGLYEAPFTNDVESVERAINDLIAESASTNSANAGPTENGGIYRESITASGETNRPAPASVLAGVAGAIGIKTPVLAEGTTLPFRLAEQPAAPGVSAGLPALAPPVVTRTFAIDWPAYADTNKLQDGTAKQTLRKLNDDLLMARQELAVAETHIDGTRQLNKKEYVTKTELDNEQLKVDQALLKVKTAQTALELNNKYEFVRMSEDFLSKYDEALRSLLRAKKEAISKLAQARAKLKAAEGRWRIESEQRRELREQMDKCTIRAQRTGLVVYGGGRDRGFFGEEQIREGATIRERQPIITIPDMTKMALKVRIHESQIKKVEKGQKARLKVDAFPDEPLEGEVLKVSVLPDSQNRWMNPDMKVYVTLITIEGSREWLKPGMSAQVEILVKELPEVIQVPIQAVMPVGGKQVCFVANGLSNEPREVTVGEFNDEFIEIKKGLKRGERVMLRAPDGVEKDTGGGSSTERQGTNSAAKPKPKSVVPGTLKTQEKNPAKSGPDASVRPEPRPRRESNP